MKKCFFMNSGTKHRKYASKSQILMKSSYLENPFAVSFHLVAWPGEAYGIDFFEKCWKSNFGKQVEDLLHAETKFGVGELHY